MHFKVQVINGVLDIDYKYLISGQTLTINEAIVKLRPGYKVFPSWVELSEEEYEKLRLIEILDIGDGNTSN